MSIQHAILGFLSWQPLSGYDLKKPFAESTTFYWSGNNNQIYRTLLQLQDEGLVSQTVVYKDSLPAKKVYAITERGLAELKTWLKTPTELPEFHNAFLIRIAWADLLDEPDLKELLTSYEQEIQNKLWMEKEKARRGTLALQRTRREAFLWQMMTDNMLRFYENELSWVRQVQKGLENIETDGEKGQP